MCLTFLGFHKFIWDENIPFVPHRLYNNVSVWYTGTMMNYYIPSALPLESTTKAANSGIANSKRRTVAIKPVR